MKKPAVSEMECGYETVDSGKQPDAAAPATPAGTHPDTAVPRAKAKAKNSQKKKQKQNRRQPASHQRPWRPWKQWRVWRQRRKKTKAQAKRQPPKKTRLQFWKGQLATNRDKKLLWETKLLRPKMMVVQKEKKKKMLSKIQRSTLVMDKWYKLPQIQKVEQDAGQRPSATGAEKYVSWWLA